MNYFQLLFLAIINRSIAVEITVVNREFPIPKLESLPIFGGPPSLEKFDNNVRKYATKASQITIFLEGCFFKPLYLIESVMDLYPTWIELSKSVNLEILHVFSMDMVFLIRELEFFIEWFLHDWEDLLYPWIVYQTRPLADEFIFQYTGFSSGFFTILGNFSFQLSSILRKMAKDVLTWINNFTNRPFKFSFITSITRNLREWIELLQRETRILMKETTHLLGIEFDASFWTYFIFDSVLVVVDLVDEMLELVNLSLVTLFWPFFLDSSDPFSLFKYFVNF